jgi:hypothetical protein
MSSEASQVAEQKSVSLEPPVGLKRNVDAAKRLFRDELQCIQMEAGAGARGAVQAAADGEKKSVLEGCFASWLDKSEACLRKWFPKLVQIGRDSSACIGAPPDVWATGIAKEIIQERFRFVRISSRTRARSISSTGDETASSAFHWFVRMVAEELPYSESTVRLPKWLLGKKRVDSIYQAIIHHWSFCFEARLERVLQQLGDEAILSEPAIPARPVGPSRFLLAGREIPTAVQTLRYSIPSDQGDQDATIGFWHADDYRTITYGGHSHRLTNQQALIVRVLNEAREQGIRNVGKQEIQTKAKCGKLFDSFRTGDGPRLWNTLVITAHRTKGLYTLNLPYPK